MKLEKRIELCDSMTPLESEIASYILNNKDAITKLKIQELLIYYLYQNLRFIVL